MIYKLQFCQNIYKIVFYLQVPAVAGSSVECCVLGVLDLTPPPPVVMTTADRAGQLEVAPQVLVKSAGHQV